MFYIIFVLGHMTSIIKHVTFELEKKTNQMYNNFSLSQ